MIACSVVDLPAPFGPIRPTISPTSTRSARSRTAGTEPYRTSTPLSASAGSGIDHRRLAEVRRGDVEVPADLVRRSRGQRSALVEHVDPVANAHHERHV